MARKGSSQAGAILVIFGIAIAIGLGYLGYTLTSRISDPFRTVETLKTQDFLERSNGLVGNTYRVTGQIEHLLSFDDEGRRIFSILTNEGDRAAALPVVVNEKHAGENFQRGQEFTFKVVVRQAGILEVEEWSR